MVGVRCRKWQLNCTKCPKSKARGQTMSLTPLEMPKTVLRCDSPVLLCGPVEASAPSRPGLCVLWSKLSWDAHEQAGRERAGREQTPPSLPPPAETTARTRQKREEGEECLPQACNIFHLP